MSARAGAIAVFGEVLFDVFEDGTRVLGGAPFNVAWHLQAFGCRPLLFSAVGEDEDGARIRAAMRGWGMDCSRLCSDPRHATGRVDVRLRAGEPSYDIAPGCAYDFIEVAADEPAPALLYHGSLALRNEVSARALERLKATAPAEVFVDVNLRTPWWSAERVAALLREATWAKLSEYELGALGGVRGESLETRAARLREEAGLAGVVVTLGARGALGVSGAETVRVAPPEATPVVDVVGAGDALSAVLILGLVAGWPLGVTLPRAQAFASEVVQRRGATAVDLALYRPFIDAWAPLR